MANYNKVILVGNLTRDPQLSYLPSQTAACEIGLAVNRRWRGQDGQQREETCFVDCRCYGKQAETLNQYVRKGNPLLVEGRLQYATWEGKDGTKRSKLRVIIERFQFLGAAAGGGRGAPSHAAAGGGPPGEPRDDADEPPPPSDSDFGGDDIPF